MAGNYHVSGTCRMGRTIADSVPDGSLRVHGLRGWRVADASLMPTLVNGNTNPGDDDRRAGGGDDGPA